MGVSEARQHDYFAISCHTSVSFASNPLSAIQVGPPVYQEASCWRPLRDGPRVPLVCLLGQAS